MSASFTYECPQSSEVCVVIPVRNGGRFLRDCLASVLQQDFPLERLSVCVHDDGSIDPVVAEVLTEFERPMQNARIQYRVSRTPTDVVCGVGGARNRAIQNCNAKYLVFLDADDEMLPDRITRQIQLLKEMGPRTIVGGSFLRNPEDATPRYWQYHRRLGGVHEELFNHAFRDIPLVMPTISCSRSVWEQIGGFVEGQGLPEDLHMIYTHLKQGGSLAKLGGAPILRYRYHPDMTSSTLHRRLLLQVRVTAFEELVLARGWRPHPTFMIWGAGRDGRDFYRCLTEANKTRVSAFCDVDEKKIGTLCHGKMVLSISEIQPPFVTCVALDRTDGAFERNLANSGYNLGTDFFYLT